MSRRLVAVLFAAVLATGCGHNEVKPVESKPHVRRVRPEHSPAIAFDSSQVLEAVPDAAVASTDWPWWRGPHNNAVSPDAHGPVRWTESENIVWKAKVPGRGHSSPTVVGSRVFLATADESAKTQSVLCYDRRTGGKKWQTEIHRGGFPPADQVAPESSHASCTVACDGERLFAAFLNGGSIWATSLDLDGKKLWQQNLGLFDSQVGYCPSPTIYKSLVIFAADHKSGGFLAGVHRKTGRIVWRTLRPPVATFSSPVVATVAGKDQLLISGADAVAAYDPAKGIGLWSVPGTATATCGTMVFDKDVVYASGGVPRHDTCAVRADGSNTVLWRTPRKAYVPSLILHRGSLYAVEGDAGILFCFDAANGNERWAKRLAPSFRSSPVIAGDRFYIANTRGSTFVFQADARDFKPLAENKLGSEMYASPAISGDQLLLRTAQGSGPSREETLYCIGKDKAKTTVAQEPRTK